MARSIKLPNGAYPPEFTEFWYSYPRKDAKVDAFSIWHKLKRDHALIMSGLEYCKLVTWRGRDAKYIPHAATWLRSQRYLDHKAQHTPVAVDSRGVRALQPSLFDSNSQRDDVSIAIYSAPQSFAPGCDASANNADVEFTVSDIAHEAKIEPSTKKPRMDATMKVTPHQSIEKIGPYEAAEYLSCSAGNRRINRATVLMYSTAMQSGKWIDAVGQFIFDADGRLIAGHHRLHAILKSGVTITACIIRNAAHGADLASNVGRPGTVGDALQMRGLTTNTRVGPVLRSIHVATNNLPNGRSAPAEEVAQLYLKYPRSDYWAAAAGKVKVRGVSRAILGAACTIFEAEFGRSIECESLVEIMRGAADSSAEHPAKRLRERFIISTIPSNLQHEIFIKVLNMMASGETTNRLQVFPRGYKRKGHEQAF
jgi:hypothetical protein